MTSSTELPALEFVEEEPGDTALEEKIAVLKLIRRLEKYLRVEVNTFGTPEKDVEVTLYFGNIEITTDTFTMTECTHEERSVCRSCGCH